MSEAVTRAVTLAWSGGKDAFMTLLALEADPEVKVQGLLSTLTEPYGRVSMHGLREELLDAQTAALGLPLVKARMPANADNESYRRAFAAALEPLLAKGVGAVAFGDLRLADVRAFREAQIHALGLEALFPLWQLPTEALARRFIASGHRAVIVCVDGEQLAPEFLGRDYDADLLAELPEGVDPCGENGEFHSFVYAGPRLARPVAFRRGRRELRNTHFHFLDLEPVRE